ncbi:MAG: sugar transferase [Calditrichia bacterium]
MIIRIQLAVKRAVDIMLSLALLAALSPLLAVVALLVKYSSPGEIIFKQRRAGKNGRNFTIYKFRTMVQDAPKSTLGSYCYQDDPRLTGIGKILRKASLDELPQFLNILKGEMSFVGPRPDLPHHAEKYSSFQRKRLRMKPGITGRAQVNGRNELSWDERIKLDVDYIETWSLLSDIKIIFKTVMVVLTGRGSQLPKKLGNLP